MTLPSSSIEPSDFHTEISTGSPELSIVLAVEIWMECAIASLRVNEIVRRSENAGRSRQAHYGAVVCISPCELDGVKFLVAVLYLAGAVCNEYRGEKQRVITVGRVRLDTEHIMRRKELVYPIGFVRSQRPGLHFVCLGRGLVVEPRLAVNDGKRAFNVGLCGGFHRQSGRVPDIEAVAEVKRIKVSERVINEAGNRPLTATDGKRQQRNIVRANGGEPCSIGNDGRHGYVELHHSRSRGRLAGIHII